MKRRLIALLLAMSVLCICVLFTSCNQESVYAAVSEAMENTKKLDSMVATMKMDMEMSLMGQTVDASVVAEIKAKDITGDAPIAYTKMKVSTLGQNQVIEAYQEGGWMYISANDMQYKTNAEANMAEYNYNDEVNNMLVDIPEEFMDDLTFEFGKDGSKTVVISIPDDEFAEIFDAYLENLNSSNGLEGGDVTISDAEVSITVLDGYISEYEMEFMMTMEMNGVTVDAEVEASIEFEYPKGGVEITPPEGYQNFEELN